MGFWALLARSRCRRGMELVSLRLWFGASSALPACPVFGILLLFWTIRCPVVIVFGGGSILRGWFFLRLLRTLTVEDTGYPWAIVTSGSYPSQIRLGKQREKVG